MHLYENDLMPDLKSFDWLIVVGGPINAYQGTWFFVIVLASLWRLCGALWRLITYTVPFRGADLLK